MTFYVLENPKPDSPEERAGRIDVIKPEKGVCRAPGPLCPRCNSALGAMSWLPPYQIEMETWGKHYGDLVRSGNDLIVSQRLMNAFNQQKLQGLQDFTPIQIVKLVHRRGIPREPLPLYYKAVVVRSTTTIDQEASGYVWQDRSKVCSECLFDTLKRWKRLVVNQASWNGHDVFFPRGGRPLMVSERFRLMVEESHFFGAIFIPSESEEAGYDSFPWEKDV